MPSSSHSLDVAHRLVLAKQLLSDGRRLSAFGQARQSFGRGLLCLHDGAELVLATIASEIGCSTGRSTSLLAYPDLIDKKSDKPFGWLKNDLRTLNEVRNLIKHAGVFPDRDALTGLADRLRANLLDASQAYLGVDLERLWMIESVRSDTVRDWLYRAEKSIEERKWESALIALGHAIYVLVEKRAHDYRLPFEFERRASWERTYPHRTDFQVVLLGYGVDPRDYSYFRSLTPVMGHEADSDEVSHRWEKWHGHEGNWTETNALWCMEFCADCVYRVEAFPVRPAPISYSALFIDEVRASGAPAEFFTLPREGVDLRTPEMQAKFPRQLLFTLNPGDVVTGFVHDEEELDTPGECVVVGLRDVEGNKIGHGIGYVARGSVLWKQVNRDAG